MLRIAPSKIDAFKRFVLAEDSEATETMYINEIMKGKEKSRPMILGTAFHLILENPEKYLFKDVYICNDISFPIDIVNECIDYINYDFPFEVRTTKEYQLENEIIVVNGVVDQLEGLCINEHKTTWSSFDYDRYCNSYQWKLYLNMFEAEKLNYKTFQMYDGANGIVLKGIREFSFEPYLKMENDIYNILNEFVNWINAKDLRKYFGEK